MSDERLERFARLLFDAYQDLNGEPSQPWDGSDGTVSEATRARFRQAADDALDVIEWRGSWWRRERTMARDERAALVEAMAEAMGAFLRSSGVIVGPHVDRPSDRAALADAALAAVEAAGWRPRPEPLTAEERKALREEIRIAEQAWEALPTSDGRTYRCVAIDAVLRSDVLRRRGIVVEGEV